MIQNPARRFFALVLMIVVAVCPPANASPTAADVAAVTGFVAAKDGLFTAVCAVIPGTQPAAAVFGIKGAIFGVISAGASLYDRAVDRKTSATPALDVPDTCGPFGPSPFPLGVATNAFLDDSIELLSGIIATDWMTLASLESMLEGHVLTDAELRDAADAAAEMVNQSLQGIETIGILRAAIDSDLEFFDGFLLENGLLPALEIGLSSLRDSNGNHIPDRIDALIPEPDALTLVFAGIVMLVVLRRRLLIGTQEQGW